MKVLWLVNVAFPEACRTLGIAAPVVGGWMFGYRDALKAFYPDIELCIVAPYDGVDFQSVDGDVDRHFLFPSDMDAGELVKWFRFVYQNVHPDVVHIHGSEYLHARLWVETCGADHTVVSLQGLTSVYADYFTAGLSEREISKTRSFHDWRKKEGIHDGRKDMRRRGDNELKVLQSVRYVAGRTQWDRCHAQAINPQLRYFQLQEILRQPFYDTRWTIDGCHRHTIFASQSHIPYKGLHKLLAALPLVVSRYPDTELNIVGQDPTRGFWFQRSGYGNILRRLISDGGLKKRIHYMGRLDAQQMAEAYRQAHVFVCPSAIENSSNSICEAQLVGTPVVASFVGGTPDLVRDGESGLLYQYDDSVVLADQICRIFDSETLATTLSEGAHAAAAERHRRSVVVAAMRAMYDQLT